MGANIDQAKYDGFIPLCIASQRGHGWNHTSYYRTTPLITASEFGYSDIVALLLSAGVNQATNYGVTSLCLASQNGYKDIYITQSAPSSLDLQDGLTPTYAASMHNRPEIVSLLLSKRANVNQAKTVGDATPLYIASLNGHEAVDGQTALHCAALDGHEKVVEILIVAKADVNAVTELVETPLHSAAQRGHTAIILLFLDANANLDMKSNT
ncbi:ankyrin 2,3/unc44 [Thraustotheca clavata]|uniref:Ankyrin 2,3/unc44 n=1 Tax=Thraustotheca clavata TaxID=74557 RepID=A0A1V9ZNH2_9STRA|nr:ankyrin 2,3/unc44 [Thraustotheca clavata]